MSFSYSLNAGQYVLMDGTSPVGRVLDEVSLALDKSDGTLHKHGSPEFVHRWFADAQKKLRDAGANEWAENLVVLTGRFPLDELNACLSNSSYAGRLYQKALAGDLKQLSFGEFSTTAAESAPRRVARP